MRREALLGTGVLLSAIAEVQWATTFLGQDDTIQAVCTFVAGAGLLLAAAAFYFPDVASGVLFLGLAAAAAAHVVYFFATLGWGIPLNVAAGLAALGLALAAWAAQRKRSDLLRVGFAGAALAGLVWTMYDLRATDAAFTVGNVFATVGFTTAAIFAVPGKDTPLG